jgi:ribosome biogenesis GTPase
MNLLDAFGWSEMGIASIPTNTDLKAGRVISIKGFKYALMTERGELETELSGKLLYGAAPEELPKVGDWVYYMDYDTMGYVVECLPRKNELTRKTPGNKTAIQVLGTNIDYALIVQGLDRDFNIMRLERYLVQLAACRVKPIVILNKSDLVTDREFYTSEVQKLQRDCPVHFCSTYTGDGLDDLKNKILQPQKTYILIGSSGVGKSSLLNAFIDLEVQKTATTSDANLKGRHTTTTRDLFQLSNGSLMIDTPGMREFGVTTDEGQSDGDLFPAIKAHSVNCRYNDCQHLNEVGCAVLAALETGELAQEVYDSYLKLVKEQRRFDVRIEDKKRLGKQWGKMSREANDFRKKYKY